MSKALVVIPTYNERENLRTLVDAILDLPEGFRILIVDDNSPDGTGKLADDLAGEHDRVDVLHREQKEGIGPAYVAGFQRALATDAEYVLQMDADLSHDPDDLPALLAAAQKADVAIGSRYVGGVRVLNWSAKRLILSLGASMYVRMVLHLPIADPTGGFKCYRREVLEALPLDKLKSRGYSFQIELNYRAWKGGFHLVEVPIVFQERMRGGSKITGGIVYEALYVLWRLRLQMALFGSGPKPEPPMSVQFHAKRGELVR